MCVLPCCDEFCRKAGSHQHWLQPRRAKTSTSSLRTTCGSFVHGAGSKLQVHAGQTHLRTLQLSCWLCDATAELRDSAEAGDIDKGHAPKSHGSSVRDATEVQPYLKNTQFPPLCISSTAWGNSKPQEQEACCSCARWDDWCSAQLSGLQGRLQPYGDNDPFRGPAVPIGRSEPRAKAPDSLAQPCLSCCPCGSLGWRGYHHLLSFLCHVEVSQFILLWKFPHERAHRAPVQRVPNMYP